MSVYPRNHTPFSKLYDSDIGVAAPHNATLGASAPALATIPAGAADMRGYSGLDAIFYFPADSADSKFKYEVLYYYKAIQQGTDDIYMPALVLTAAVDNLIGAETGLANSVVLADGLFADTLLDSMALGYHGQGLNDALYGTTPGAATPEIAALSNSTANGIAVLHLRHITADWVRIHVYAGATTSYVKANVLVRLVNE